MKHLYKIVFCGAFITLLLLSLTIIEKLESIERQMQLPDSWVDTDCKYINYDKDIWYACKYDYRLDSNMTFEDDET